MHKIKIHHIFTNTTEINIRSLNIIIIVHSYQLSQLPVHVSPAPRLLSDVLPDWRYYSAGIVVPVQLLGVGHEPEPVVEHGLEEVVAVAPVVVGSHYPWLQEPED